MKFVEMPKPSRVQKIEDNYDACKRELAMAEQEQRRIQGRLVNIAYAIEEAETTGDVAAVKQHKAALQRARDDLEPLNRKVAAWRLEVDGALAKFYGA